MMMYPHGMGDLSLFAPVAVLLAVIFFVLVMLQQVKGGALKFFGVGVAVILTVVVALLLASSINNMMFKCRYRPGIRMMPTQKMPDKIMPKHMERMEKVPAKQQ